MLQREIYIMRWMLLIVLRKVMSLITRKWVFIWGYILACFVFLPATSYASKYKPNVNFNYKLGNERNLGRAEIFLPLWQVEDNLVFVDSQGFLDSNDTKEGNLGLGFRKIINNKFVFGAYGFYDQRKTENNNKFKQVTLGLELLTEQWEFRSNFYLADQENKVISSSSSSSGASDPYLLGNYVYTDTVNTNSNSYESNLGGYDIEIGRDVPFLPNVQLFAAYYHFANDDIDEKVDGYRIREQYNFFSKKGHDLFLEAEHSDDGLRGGINFFGLRYSYNFAGKELTNNQRGFSKLESKMENRVIRDVDIITKKTNNPATTTTEITRLTDETSRKIIYVDNDALLGGDGTKENPYQTLAEASSASAENDVIYVYYGDGSAYDDGITLKNGQKLLGQGEDFVVSDVVTGTSYADSVLIDSDNYSKVTKEFTGGDSLGSEYDDNVVNRTGTINLSDNNLVRGLEVSSTNTDDDLLFSYGDSIVINNKTGNVISNNKIRNVAANGVLIVSSSSNEISNTVVDNEINDLYLSAVSIYGKDDSLNEVIISDNTVYDSHDGISLDLDTASTSVNLKVERNYIHDQEYHGIAFYQYSLNENNIIDLGGGSLDSEGQNAITDSVVLIDVDVVAKENYWGGGDLTNITKSTGAAIDSTDYLVTNPFLE